MTLRQRIFNTLHPISITTRFALGIGMLLALIVTVSLTGYLSIFFVRSAEKAIEVSTEIQRMVLAMDRGMERARRLHADFHLQYPTIGLAAAHERYAQPSVRQVAQVITISHDLKILIDRSRVSDALLQSRVDLNLYLSSAKRFTDTSIQSVELVTELAAPARGLEAQLDNHMDALRKRMVSHQTGDLYARMRAYVQEYRISRERHLMQSAYNIAFQVRTTIDSTPSIQANKKQAINELLLQFNSTAEKILAIDAAIKSKFNDFAIQAEAVAPISTALIALANAEVQQARIRIARLNKAAIIIMAAITVAGLVLAVYIARVLNRSITLRVARLTAAAAELRAGNLKALAEEQGEDELSELARTFNMMAARIRELVHDLELKVAQRTAELAESEGRFRDLFEHSSSGVAVYRPVDGGEDFIFQDFNKAAESIEQVKREQIIGKRVTAVFPAIKEFGLLDVFRRVAQTGQSAHHPVGLYSDGRLTGWRENSVYQLPSGEIVAVYDDQTAQKKAELEKEVMERQLHQARKMEAIGVLAGGIAHDFNNILGIILGNSELALDDIAEWNPVAMNLKEIRTASLRAKDVIRQLLSFSRKAELKMKAVSVMPVIRESLSLMRASIPSNITIKQDISEDCGAIVADPTQIHQVMINLCTNAAHAMEGSGGTLHVTAERVAIEDTNTAPSTDIRPGTYIELKVSDTGSGVPSAIKHRIFDPYFTTKEVGKGSGMGLAVVHGIVKNHGGMISIESEPEKGSTFTILFPAAEGEGLKAPANQESVIGGSECLLLIDDEPSLLKSIGSFLERRGYRVKSYTDPVAAWQFFALTPHDFDLVITDMTMPNLTGLELAGKILRTRPDIPIILCSGYSDAIDEEIAKQMGISRYVEKPVMLSELAAHVHDVLESIDKKRGA